MQYLSYFFWPRLGPSSYSNPKELALLIMCAAFLVLALAIKMWRARTKNPVTKKLSRSWGAASFWFGLTGLMLVVARVEDIQFIEMRFLWVIWVIVLGLFVFFQVRNFRARHYKVLPTVTADDPLAKYLPKAKKH